MIEDSVARLIDESIQLEMNLSDLYFFFKKTFSEDKVIWDKLADEEKKHAAFIESARAFSKDESQFPSQLVSAAIQSVMDTNDALTELMGKYEKEPPSRISAFRLALKMEHSVGEIHFQNAMKHDKGSDIIKMLKELYELDQNHIKRITEYMAAQGIE
ncbi:MAG: hypothetical protein K9L30_01750 [Desulfobacterales bacterium]|nr:hypothetical protein [Desulfobacterales bacterium]